jgi:hypothetical protein
VQQENIKAESRTSQNHRKLVVISRNASTITMPARQGHYKPIQLVLQAPPNPAIQRRLNRAEGSMAWLAPTDAEIAALLGARIDVVAFDVHVIDAAGRREAVA